MTTSTAPVITGRDWRRSAVAGMASYLDAAAIVSTGTALVLYQKSLGIAASTLGLLSATLTLAIAVGALSGGRLGDRFGRRRVFTVTMALLTVGTALMALAGSVPLLLVGILLTGFAAGADLPVSLALIAEEAPVGAAGKLVVLSQVLWYAGFIVTQLLTIIFSGLGVTAGRILFAHVAVISVVVLLLRLRMPESARWVESRNRLGTDQAVAPRPGVRALLTREMFLPLAGLIGFYGLVNIIMNTKGQFTTFLFVNVAGSTVRTASTVSLVSLSFGLVCSLFFMRIVDGRNRMRWFTLGAVALTISQLVPAVVGINVVTLSVSTFMASFGAALCFEGILKVWSQELFPTLLRATAQGTVISAARLIAALAAVWTPVLLLKNPHLVFVVFTSVLVVGLTIGFLVGHLAKGNDHLKTDGDAPAPGVGATTSTAAA